MANDFDLLDRWRAGDRDSGNALLARHFDSIYRFFRNKLGDGVDDLIQRTFLAAVNHRDRFRKQSTFRTFLFVVARHELYRHLRLQRRPEEATDLTQMSVAALGLSPSVVLAKRQEERLLLEALRRIPLDLQIAIELFYWEDLSTGEMAEALEVPQGTAKSRLRRARLELEAQMRLLADSDEVLKSTLSKFEDWAGAVRRAVTPQKE